MKRIITILVFSATTIFGSASSNASPLTIDQPFSQVLQSYYDVKNALVNGDAATASAKATVMVKSLGAVDMKTLSEADHKAFMSLQEKLNFDAQHISASNDIAQQRDHFSSLSNNIYTLAKAVKLSADPVYQEYCPMKKMYWLSSESAIKNPYYGKSMLTCGKVTDTIQ
jgi:hypothetical protein